MITVDVSIVIPTKNRARTLGITVESMARQSFPSDRYEIVVIDNGSTDNTAGIVETMIREFPNRQIRTAFEPAPGLLAGRHRGVKETEAPLLIFVDDDIKAHSCWLAAIVDSFRDSAVHMVGGRNLPEYESSPPEWISRFQHPRVDGGWSCGQLSVLDFGNKRQVVDPCYVWGLNFAIRRESLVHLGGFHPDGVPWELRRFRGDGETAVSVAMRQQGMTAIYEPQALVHHMIPASRLTEEYFERRSFLQGVSDSYTAIRSEYFAQERQTRLQRIVKACRKPIGQVKRRIKIRLSSALKVADSEPKRTDSIEDRAKHAYRTGYEYHQQEVASDPRLFEWVVRPNYWDCWFPTDALSFTLESNKER